MSWCYLIPAIISPSPNQTRSHFVSSHYCSTDWNMHILTHCVRHKHSAWNTLLYTSGGTDIKVWSNGGMLTSMAELKKHGQKPSPLPVVTWSTKFQHISNLESSIPYEDVRQLCWSLLYSMRKIHVHYATLHDNHFVQTLECPGSWAITDAQCLQRKFLEVHTLTPSLQKWYPQLIFCLCSDPVPILWVRPDRTASKHWEKIGHMF
jgi:hypothetical protein